MGKFGTHCPHCKHAYSSEFIAERYALMKKRLISAIAEKRRRGEPIGRRPGADTSEVVKLRRHGYSMRKIAKILNVSPSTVLSHLKKHAQPSAVKGKE